MSDKPLITIIVPVYKVEEYLDDCVTSICSQTYQNLQIILVDDGSPDKCGAMCDAWAEKDPRIEVLHTENGGLSAARNNGLEKLRGGYFSFVDSDDWLPADAVDTLYTLMIEEQADMAVGGTCFVNLQGKEENRMNGQAIYKKKRWSGREILLIGSGMDATAARPVWARLYKTTVAGKIRQPVGMLMEDFYCKCDYYYPCGTVAVTSTPVYYYRQRYGSLMDVKRKKENIYIAFNADFQARIHHYAYYKEKQDTQLQAMTLADILSAQTHELEHLTAEERKKLDVQPQPTIRKYGRQLLALPGVSVSRRCKTLLMMASAPLYMRLRGQKVMK